ncbi:MAG: DUF5685 family protein [Clostridiales bacterium]|nr:DUF5685 family protein [Clostridiales bacterium]
MFGYIAPLKSELKMREYTQYRAWYCGLCKAIRAQYGQIPRLALSYDCAFFALLLAALQGCGQPCVPQKCWYKPLKAAAPVAPANDALKFVADINILLYYHKLEDDWKDERKPAALIGKGALHAAAKKATLRQATAAAVIRSGQNTLSLLERQNEPSIDVTADAFASMLRDVAAAFPLADKKEKDALGWLCYHLGRWIYIADAWDDRKKDLKANAFNPLLVMPLEKDAVSFLLYAAVNEMEKAYDLLTVKQNRGLLDNIIYKGCRTKSKLLLEGMKP